MATAAPTATLASNSESPLDAPPLAIAGVGLPIIAGGRIRNYIFVSAVDKRWNGCGRKSPIFGMR